MNTFLNSVCVKCLTMFAVIKYRINFAFSNYGTI